MKKILTRFNLKKIALFATVAAFSTLTHAQSYIQSSCDFAPMSSEGTFLCLGDDMVSAAIPLGFTFDFYGTSFTDCYVSSNGFLTFTAALASGCCTGQVLPNGTYTYTIFFGQEDLDPNTCVDGDITYYTTGDPGSQIFVLSFTDVPHFPGPEGTFPVTVQVQLYEGTNEVRIVTTQYNGDGGSSTMGLNEDAGNADIVPGRNSADWSAFDECISFIPDGLPDAGCMDFAAINYDPDAIIDDGSCIYGYYSLSMCESAPLSNEGTLICLGDDIFSESIPLGFSFNYYGTSYSDAYVSSNGYLSFDNLGLSGCCTGQFLPNATYTNSIFFGQEDLDPNSCVDGDISYYTTGDPGARIFVLSFTDVPHYPGPEGNFPVTVQLQLYETTGEIRIVTTEYNGDGGNSTMGLNLDGATYHAAPGRNSSNWSAYDDCLSWMPYDVPFTCVTPGGLFVDGITDNDAVLHWEPVEGADQYRVVLWNTVTGTIGKKGVVPNTYSLTDNLTPLTTYAFRVKTVCYEEGVISTPSEWVYWTTLGRIGETMGSVAMYPNPSNGTFNLTVNGYDQHEFQLNIYDALGKIIYNQSIVISNNNYNYIVNLEGVSAGMYQVELMNSEYQMTYPVMIQK